MIWDFQKFSSSLHLQCCISSNGPGYGGGLGGTAVSSLNPRDQLFRVGKHCSFLQHSHFILAVAMVSECPGMGHAGRASLP